MLASLPSVAVTSLIAYDVIHPTLGLALGLAAVLLVLDRLGWRIVVGHVRPRAAHHTDQVTRCRRVSRAIGR